MSPVVLVSQCGHADESCTLPAVEEVMMMVMMMGMVMGMMTKRASPTFALNSYLQWRIYQRPPHAWL